MDNPQAAAAANNVANPPAAGAAQANPPAAAAAAPANNVANPQAVAAAAVWINVANPPAAPDAGALLLIFGLVLLAIGAVSLVLACRSEYDLIVCAAKEYSTTTTYK
ncbi:uncharacterized protein [Triticum aestivum]|uniref:uncharacterized protein isoform X1 n=1 Tax=Triticum aestivum TaxID=4565 RepID=UPI001D033B3F|nr:uncharacterized protein LOC123100383 isoform X1 [Triticum aestivum]